MSILRTAIRCAIAAGAVGAAANSASALDVSTYNAATAVNVYLSGSTAVDNTILNAALETASPGGMCNTGTIDVYFIGSTGGYTNRMIFCTGSPTSGASGSPLAIFKESNVGSSNGVEPLYDYAGGASSGLTFINPAAISDALCAGADGGAVGVSGNLAAYTAHSSCPSTAITLTAVPTAGFADVEAAILKTAGGSNENPALTAKYLNSFGTLDQVWALAMTKNAYYALQAAEGYASPSDSPANAPSLSHEQVAGLVSGNIFNWNDIGLSPADTSVYICRRDIGSGTEASHEYEWLGERCGLSDLQVPAEGNPVWANASGGKVRSCLQTLMLGGTQNAYYTQSKPQSHLFPAGNQYAVGFLNDEVKKSDLTGAGDSFRFPAIDGAGPTLANVQNGSYQYFSTGVAYTIKSGTGVLGAGAAGTGNSAASSNVVTALKGKLGNPQFTSDSNANYTGILPWSPTESVGDMSPAPIFAASNAPTNPATSATAAANPTNTYTKATSGAVNNCDMPTWDSADLEGIATTTVQKGLLGTGAAGAVND